MLALAPLALLTARVAAGCALCCGDIVAYLFFTWWLLTHRLDRFWLPLLPPLAILAGLGADWSRGRAWTVILGVIVTVGLVIELDARSRRRWPASTNGPATWSSCAATSPGAGTHRSPGSTPSCPRTPAPLVGQAAVFHLRHHVAYNTVFNPEIIETLASDKSPDAVRPCPSRAEAHARLRRLEGDRAASAARRLRIHRFRDAQRGSPNGSPPECSRGRFILDLTRIFTRFDSVPPSTRCIYNNL